MFQPSPHSEIGASSVDAEALLREYAPVARTVLDQVTDATRQQAVLKARIVNLRRLRNRMPPIARGPINARIRIARAKLTAAQRRVEIQEETTSAQRTYRALGQTGIVVTVLVGIGILTLIVRKARG